MREQINHFEFIDAGLETKEQEKVSNGFEIVESKNEPSISQDEINEAYEWDRLFNEGYITAHEMADLPKEALPELDGELFKAETEDLLKIKELLDLELDDKEFREKISDIGKLLPRPFGAMQGMGQTQPHWGIDPTEHTLNALRELNTEGLAKEDQKIARSVIPFHDVGKVIDPLSRCHPKRSKEIAADYVKKMGWEGEDGERILRHIAYHDALGDIARRDGYNILDPDEVALFFPDLRELELHHRVVKADVSSIPGLAAYLRNIDLAYEAMRKRLQGEKSDLLIEMVQNVELPFPKIDTAEFLELKDKLFSWAEFDEIVIDEEMARRHGNYNSLEDKEREIIEKAIVQYGLQNRNLLLDALKITGRETDDLFITELEKKYGVEIPNAKMASNVFGLTYRMWEMNNILRRAYYGDDGRDHEDDEDYEATDDIIKKEEGLIKEKLMAIKKYAQDLAVYQAHATHITDIESARMISAQRNIEKSDSSISHHYEGSGVYTGILGSFKDWQEGSNLDEIKEFNFEIEIKDTLPIMVNYKYPQAMANVLGDGLFIPKEGETRAHPVGLREWNNSEYDERETEEWKIKMLEKILDCRAVITKDEKNERCVILDTEEAPVVWASLCRALRIKRAIPESELFKVALPSSEMQKASTYLEQEKDEILPPGIRIKGIRSDKDKKNLL